MTRGTPCRLITPLWRLHTAISVPSVDTASRAGRMSSASAKVERKISARSKTTAQPGADRALCDDQTPRVLTLIGLGGWQLSARSDGPRITAMTRSPPPNQGPMSITHSVPARSLPALTCRQCWIRLSARRV
ncbi:hypothetical protein PV04_04924 [Phialophora macrospora]|uniref:Uncharacterized protein n=1 Tax=Phialophora macrospora TaxID=1851006 RepID=A0A0D2FR78_9EURO|nr:hypothetical protein PV04_04924 [Phialophora macrospora]